MMVKAKEGSGPAQANRVKAVLSRLTTLAIEDGNCFHNPCRSIKPYALEPRQGYLTPAQASALMRACASYPHQEPANVVRLLLFTGARLGEVLSATWSQFDLENGVWTKPSAHTKARRVHRLALTTEAVELLRAMEESRASSLYLFPGRKPGTHLTTIRRPWKGILAAAGLGHWYRHDLRRTTATLMLSAGADVTSVGKTLGHTQAQTTLRYAQLMPDHQRQMLSRGLELVSAHAA
jgi:integrase